MNAKATAKFKPFLDAMNSGKALPGFANGGAVGGHYSPTASLPSNPAPTRDKWGSHQVQVFNINVTGDISRQTRAEIQRMIPQLTNSINSQNHELGYR